MGAAIILFPKVKEETIAYSTSIEDLFEKEGHFYVYFNRKECPYCDNIEDDIKQFKKENAVYEIDAEACKGTRNYDWDSHEKKYDVEIGEKDSTRKIVFYDGLDENLIKEKYPPIHYKIIWANENYAALHEGKEAGKVYAISTHPNIKKEELSEKKFTPILSLFWIAEKARVAAISATIFFFSCFTVPKSKLFETSTSNMTVSSRSSSKTFTNGLSKRAVTFQSISRTSSPY